uniref:C-type lectin domain-containing protein n=1 Tax=Sparus aurata TaxID=8175 RepID=A0A671XX89_SPAAU
MKVFSLVLGQCSLFTCQLFKYHFIDKTRSWDEAQKYCREKHTDLVTVYEETDIDLSNTAGLYWIGLFADTWRWSDGSSSFFRPWSQTFPVYHPGISKCATLNKDGRWNTANCNSQKPFFCYNNVILIKENKTWEEAINYCREKHNDLISITDAEQQRWVQERAKNATSSHVWLALRFTCILEVWFWVTDERVDYKNWAPNVKMDDCNMSGAMEAGGKHKWIKEDDMMKFNFFCSKS